MNTELPTIVTAAELGQLFDLSERSIREHRAKGHVFRLGKGYDFKRSVQGMLDYERMQMLARALGGRYQEVWNEFDGVLEYRRDLSDRHDQLEAGVLAVLAMPDLPEEARTALLDLLPPDDEGDEHGG